MGWFGNKRFRLFVSRADAARDEAQYAAAAALYREALRVKPDHRGVLIQLGHVLKEDGRFLKAEESYLAAEKLRPDDPELALQLGHLHKLTDRLGEAQAAYERALVLRPGWLDAQRELTFVEKRRVKPQFLSPAPVEAGSKGDILGSRSGAELAQLVPALAPQKHENLRFVHGRDLHIRRLGRLEETFWGTRSVLRGVEAILGFKIADQPVVEIHLLIDGIRIYRGPLRGGYRLRGESSFSTLRKYVFNIWLDFEEYTEGLHCLELHLFGATGQLEVYRQDVVIGAPVREEAYPDSNARVSVSYDSTRSIEEQIRCRPSMVKPARGPLFPEGVQSVLVLRTDQLGDMIASVSALQRLRALLPSAKLVGVLTAANAELATTLGLFDDVIVVDFPDDPVERRRLMTLDAQEALRAKLLPYAFDIAIDLAHAHESRPLLRLADAKFTYGFGGGNWPWLSCAFEFHTRDRWTRHDFVPHSTKVLALVESLGTVLRTSAPIIKQVSIPREILSHYGIGPSDQFAVIHCGARLAIKRWDHFGELARILLNQTDLKLVLITEDLLERSGIPADVLADPRVITSKDRLPFDHFDALLSYATVVVGNDSGPKHLASLRGTNVVSIFGARTNWLEWGQENVGSVISRKLPCAGCMVHHDPEECGRDFICLSDIKPQEVFEAMKVYICQAKVKKA
jgi:ADP-heptose:LPS heptosyltransferase/tetratricopeptide (TPR) repeat protein